MIETKWIDKRKGYVITDKGQKYLKEFVDEFKSFQQKINNDMQEYSKLMT